MFITLSNSIFIIHHFLEVGPEKSSDVRHPGNYLTTPLTLPHVYPTPLTIAETIVSKKLRITSIQEGTVGVRSWYSTVVVERTGADLGLGLV